jgi:hypothetical protein
MCYLNWLMPQQELDRQHGTSPQVPSSAEQQHQPSAASALPCRHCSIRDGSDHHSRSASQDAVSRQPSGHHQAPGPLDTQTAVAVELVGRKPEQALQLLRAALAVRGVHGAVEFSQQLRLASSATTSHMHTIGFADIARVVDRFCKMADAYIHAIFRALDKDCNGCVLVSEIIDSVFVRLTTQRMNQVKIVFAVRPKEILLLFWQST